jgi:chromatin segregation and condensation protein Rec8/ScpA/Scc1 (kleisin family)
MICALLAVLEMVRLQALVLTQKELFGSIVLRKHKMFDAVFSGETGGEAVADGATEPPKERLKEIDEQYQ